MQRVLTAWHPGPGNAGDFYKKFGFVETGEKIDDEIVAAFKALGINQRRPINHKNWKRPRSLEALPCKSVPTHLTITNRSS
jgi:hypothetical protein